MCVRACVEYVCGKREPLATPARYKYAVENLIDFLCRECNSSSPPVPTRDNIYLVKSGVVAVRRPTVRRSCAVGPLQLLASVVILDYVTRRTSASLSA